MKLSEFMELSVEDLEKMRPEELHSELKGAAGTLNRRYQNIRSRSRKRSGKNVTSQEAVRQVAQSGGRFSTKGTKKEGKYNISAMRREFARMKKFYKSPASTVKGAKQRAKEISEQWFGEGAEEGLTGGQLGELREKENKAYELAARIRELGGDKYKDVLYRIEEVKSNAKRSGWGFRDMVNALDRLINEYQNEISANTPENDEGGLWAAKARKENR